MAERQPQITILTITKKWRFKALYLLIFGLCLIFSPHFNQSMTFQLSVNLHAKEQKPSPKHCVSAIDVKFRETYMIVDWLSHAKQQALSKWKRTAKKRFGSVYSNWHVAENQKATCLRIGFGNDQKGNVGTSVVCQYSGEPCAILVNSEAVKVQNRDKN